MSSAPAVVIDAAVRFARTNPELMGCAYAAALQTGHTVDSLLLDAVARVRATAAEHHPVAAVGTQPRPVVLAAQRRRYRRNRVDSSRRIDSSTYS